MKLNKSIIEVRALANLLNISKNGDKRTVAAGVNILYSFGIRGGSILISLLIVPLTLRCLTPLEYGIWVIINSVLNWITYFDIGLTNGLRNKLAIALANEDIALGRTYVSTTFFLLSILVLFMVLVFGGLCYFLDWNHALNVPIAAMPDIAGLIFTIFVIFGVSFVARTVGTIYVANQQPAINDLLNFLGAFLSLIVIYILTEVDKGTLWNIAIVFSVCPLIVYVVAYPVTFYGKYQNLRPRFSYIRFEHAKGLIGLGMQFFLLQIACLIMFSTANILISRLFNPTEVTPYNIIFKYFSLVTMFFAILINPLWTAITDASVKSDVHWIEKSISRIYYGFAGCFVLVVFLVIFSNYIIKFWIGNVLVIPMRLTISMGAYTIVFIWTQIFATFSNGIGLLKVQVYSMCVASALFIPVAIVLARWLGVEGITIAMTLVLFIPAIALYREYKYRIAQMRSHVL